MTISEYSYSTSNTAAIDASSYWREIVSGAICDTVKFFNSLTIHNNSSKDIKVLYDGRTDDYDYLPASGILIRTGKNFRFINILNTDAANAIAIGELQVRVEKSKTNIAAQGGN